MCFKTQLVVAIFLSNKPHKHGFRYLYYKDNLPCQNYGICGENDSQVGLISHSQCIRTVKKLAGEVDTSQTDGNIRNQWSCQLHIIQVTLVYLIY